MNNKIKILLLKTAIELSKSRSDFKVSGIIADYLDLKTNFKKADHASIKVSSTNSASEKVSPSTH